MTTNQKILVTGADGFIGSHLIEKLIHHGYDVRAFVLYNSFNSWGWLDTVDKDIRNEMDVFAGDVRDPEAVKLAMKDCDTVLHLASLIAIPYSYQAPASYVETNILGTLNILQSAKYYGVDRVVCTSTSEVYGTARQVPIEESHVLQPQSPYSASKIGADAIALSFYHSFQLPVTILRPFNTYGPRQSARAVIPTVISQIASKQKELSLGALHPTRDFTFVEDTANGFIQAMHCDQIVGDVTNIGSDFEISIGDLVNLIAELMNYEVSIEIDEQRLRPDGSEVNRLWADVGKAKKLMGWCPEHEGIQGMKKGLKKTIDWFTDSENLKRYKVEEYNI